MTRTNPVVSRRRAILICAGVTLAMGQRASAGRTQTSRDQTFPDVVDVKAKSRGGGVFDFDVTVSSPYDTPARYADAFRVRNRDGTVYGERILLHDHQTEQPFTRDLTGVAIPAGVSGVVVEGRDQKSGWGGKTLDVVLPGR